MCSNTHKQCSRTQSYHFSHLFSIFVVMIKKYTIRDIAKLAGVSKGTVDRVLHKRGKVSETALKKVTKVLDEIDFKPNPIAKNLKNNKIYRLCILLPDTEMDAYWKPCLDAVKEIETNYHHFGIRVDKYLYDPSSTSSFTETALELIETKPDAVLMAPLFFAEAQEISNTCKEENILVTTFNNIIEKDSGNNFIGQDLYQSGRIGAKLLDMILTKGHLAIVHIDEVFLNATYIQEKEKGFRNYFKSQNNENFKISTLNIKQNSDLSFEESLNEHLAPYPDINGVFITTSKTYMVAESNFNSSQKLKIVGYDLVDSNVSFLKDGTIDFLIHQSPKKQAFLGLSYLAEYFLFGKEIPKKILLPIDIINSENVEQYML